MILVLKAELKMEDGIMMNSFDEEDDFQSLLLNAISGVDSLLHMQYQRKDRKRKCSVSYKRTKTGLGAYSIFAYMWVAGLNGTLINNGIR